MDNHISIDGIKFAYTLSGNEPAIVLLHGWMCNRKFWREKIQLLSKTHKVLALDFRGHGDSDVPQGDFTLDQPNEDVYNIIKGVGIKSSRSSRPSYL